MSAGPLLACWLIGLQAKKLSDQQKAEAEEQNATLLFRQKHLKILKHTFCILIGVQAKKLSDQQAEKMQYYKVPKY